MERSSDAQFAAGNEDAQSPEVLNNNSEFPPLPAHTRPGMLLLPTHTMSITSTSQTSYSLSSKSQALKRSLTKDTDPLSQNDGSSSSQVSLTTSPPPLKSQRLAYRDNNPMQSIDSDMFRSRFNSPTLSDSQQSDTWTSITQLKTSYNASLGSLGSLGDIFNNATLNSLKGLPSLEMVEPSSSPQDHSLIPPPHTNDSSSCSPNDDLSEKSELVDKLDVEKADVPSQELLFGKEEIAYLEPVMSVSSSSSSESGRNSEAAMSVSGSNRSESGRMSVTFMTTSSTSSSESGRPRFSSNMSNSSQSIESSNFDSVLTSSTSYDLSKKTDEEEKSVNSFVKKDSESVDNKANKDQDKKDDVHHTEDEDTNTSEEEDSIDEETYSSDSELQQMFEKCKKNPRHKKFHSPDSLKVSDLPLEIQHEDTITFLTCMSQLVVQITVNSTSAARGPHDRWSEYIGTNKKRNGSGFVANVDPDILRFRCKQKNCPYGTSILNDSSSSVDESSVTSPTFDRSLSNISTASTSSCSSSSGSKKHYHYGGVNIRTNKHIIFDKTEADNATVKFFFNSENSQEVIHGHVGAIVGINNKQDHVIIHVMSHDKNLFNKLESCLKNARMSYDSMNKSTQTSHQVHAGKFPHSWVAVISHPHGAAKLISLGRVMQEKMDLYRVVKYYNAPTCPGSSGGLVITPTLLKLQWPGAVHNCYDKKTKFNVTFDSRFPDLNIADMTQMNKVLTAKKESYSYSGFKL